MAKAAAPSPKSKKSAPAAHAHDERPVGRAGDAVAGHEQRRSRAAHRPANLTERARGQTSVGVHHVEFDRHRPRPGIHGVGRARQVDGRQVAFFWSPTDGFTTLWHHSTNSDNGDSAYAINDLDQVTGNLNVNKHGAGRSRIWGRCGLR